MNLHGWYRGELLKTFKKCLGLKNKITTSPPGKRGKKNYYRVQFGSVQFYRWLEKNNFE